MRIVARKSYRRNDNAPDSEEKKAPDFPDLPAEWAAAWLAMTAADIRELEEFGVTSRCAKYGLVGISPIIRFPDSKLYEPHPSGISAFITPVRAEDRRTPEATDAHFAVRVGDIIDLVAWDPRAPLDWALRTGAAEWLGAVPPQYCDPDWVRVRQSPLDWLREDCTGIVPLSNDPARIYRLLMDFEQAGIYVKNEEHAIALRRLVERPWPLPDIGVAPE
jgi:hypothetical protein